MRDHDELASRAALALSVRLPEPGPEILLVLGDGLTKVADLLEDPVEVPVAAIPGLEVSRAAPHRDVLRYGHLGGRPVLAQLAPPRLYEGFTTSEVVRMVDVAAELGCGRLVTIDAVGALTERFRPGELLVITDQLNLTGRSPLAGRLRDGQPVFLEMDDAYSAALVDLTAEVADDLGLPLHSGVYAGRVGPVRATRAEAEMLRILGAQLVGTSVVLEVAAARARELEVLGLGVVAGLRGRPAGRDAELEEVAGVAGDVGALIRGVVERL